MVVRLSVTPLPAVKCSYSENAASLVSEVTSVPLVTVTVPILPAPFTVSSAPRLVRMFDALSDTLTASTKALFASANASDANTPVTSKMNGESIKLNFLVPGAKLTLNADGSVVWDDKHGKAGINFQCASVEDQNRFAAWLDHEFYMGTSIGAGRSRAAESQG